MSSGKPSEWIVHSRPLKKALHCSWLPLLCWKVGCWSHRFPSDCVQEFLFSPLFTIMHLDVVFLIFYFPEIFSFLLSVAWYLSNYIFCLFSNFQQSPPRILLSAAPIIFLPLLLQDSNNTEANLLLYTQCLWHSIPYFSLCATAVARGFSIDTFLWLIFHLIILFSAESDLLMNSSTDLLISVMVFLTSEIITGFFSFSSHPSKCSSAFKKFPQIIHSMRVFLLYPSFSVCLPPSPLFSHVLLFPQVTG